MSTENKIKLLMVDDEVKFLKSISSRLELQDFDVTSASNGEEAIMCAENGFFDVAVVDFRMPGIDGVQVLKTLKDRHKYLEIIILTGHATIDSAVESTKLGAFQYIEKPYAFDKLVETIKDAYEARLKRKFAHNTKRKMMMRNRLFGYSSCTSVKSWENKSIITRNFIITVFLILFSINSVASVAEDDIFEIETEGSYLTAIGTSNNSAREMASSDDLFQSSGKEISGLGQYLYGESHSSLYFA